MSELEQLDTRSGILKTAKLLASKLQLERSDLDGARWTAKNFNLLRVFCQQQWGINPKTDCFHKKRKGHPSDLNEFLWDFIATTKERGILLAAESEQKSHTKRDQTGLNHDFEKLLYVFAPIRLLIVKGKAKDESDIVAGLQRYIGGCCQNFNPGSVFLIHYRCWTTKDDPQVKSSTYYWQADGKPKTHKTTDLKFLRLSTS
jgi:hypothetical protein